MNKILFILSIIVCMSLQVFSTDYICNGNIELNNYENINNINVQENCNVISFEYSELITNNIKFNLYDDGYDTSNVITINDYTQKEVYESNNIKSFEFEFKDFTELYIKYTSEYDLITKDYINKNKFIGNQNLNAIVEIENSVIGGQKYYIAGAFINYKKLELNFENFGDSTDIVEYRIFLNDIENVIIYTDNGNSKGNEKILIIKDNVDLITIDNLIDNGEFCFNYRIGIIDFETFIENGINNIYMETLIEDEMIEDVIKDINKDINKDNIVEKTIEIVKESSIPFGMYGLGLLIVFVSTFIVRRDEGMVIKTKRHMIKHLSFAMIPSLLVLFFTKNGIIALLTSVALNSIYSIIYYRNTMNKKMFMQFMIQTIILIVLIGIGGFLYKMFIQ